VFFRFTSFRISLLSAFVFLPFYGFLFLCDDDAVVVLFITVEGSPKCERWIENDGGGKESTPQWSDRLIENPDLSWKYPFAENHSFILTVRAGLEGYHISVDGKHIASFPYTTVSYHHEQTPCKATKLSSIWIHSTYMHLRV
jgi:hypothetical protein